MAYLEVRRCGKLTQRRQINNRSAQRGVTIRLKGGKSIRLELGHSRVLNDYEIKLVEESIDQGCHDTVGVEEYNHPTFSKLKGAITKKQTQPNKTRDSLAQPDIEGFTISGLLGQGGMGTVWKAKQLSTNREVALKFLGSHSSKSRRAMDRFHLEVMLSARLSHPNIARIYDSGLHKGNYYYVMELVEGIRLEEYVQRANLNQEQILALMIKICNGVEYAHGKNVIHRDLKPSNILVTQSTKGEPHILDFGLAQPQIGEEDDIVIAIQDGVSGTPGYMSPEQASGRHDSIDHRTDIYSLGVILYQLLTGFFPRDMSGSYDELMERIIHQDVIPPRLVNRNISQALEAILMKALARDRNDRYATVSAFKKDLQNYLQGWLVEAEGLYLNVRHVIEKHIPLGLLVRIVLIVTGISVLIFLLYFFNELQIQHQIQSSVRMLQGRSNQPNEEEHPNMEVINRGNDNSVPPLRPTDNIYGPYPRPGNSFSPFTPQGFNPEWQANTSRSRSSDRFDRSGSNLSKEEQERAAEMMFESIIKEVENGDWETATENLNQLQLKYSRTHYVEYRGEFLRDMETYIRQMKSRSSNDTTKTSSRRGR